MDKKKLLNSEQELQRSVASKAQSTGEPSQKTTECYIPVSVEDELPEAIDGNEKIIVKGNIGWFECRWDSSYGFYDNEPSEEIDWDSITHWLKKTTLSPVKDDWKELEKIAPPDKWIKMYEHYQEILTAGDTASWWHEQYLIANSERNQLKWLNEIRAEQNNYPMFKWKELDEKALVDLHKQGKTPIEALNDLSTTT
jgi:hypothetical protein